MSLLVQVDILEDGQDALAMPGKGFDFEKHWSSFEAGVSQSYWHRCQALRLPEQFLIKWRFLGFGARTASTTARFLHYSLTSANSGSFQIYFRSIPGRSSLKIIKAISRAFIEGRVFTSLRSEDQLQILHQFLPVLVDKWVSSWSKTRWCAKGSVCPL